MKFSVILGNLGNTCDRFVSTGYKEQPSKEEMVRQAASIPGVSAVELVGSWDITEKNAAQMRRMLDDNGLTCSCIIPDLFANKIWAQGSLSSRQPAIRKKAVECVKQVVDMCGGLGCKTINLWPGQDGYDYCFQDHFAQARDHLVESVKICAEYAPSLSFALEYKCKEPRTHSYLARAADTLLLAMETECPNVGVTIDTGHAMAAGENMAEAASLLLRAGKLFHLHFNDNYRAWDDDMIVGSVHFIEYAELLYWLNRLGYKGWYSMDQYPYREEAQGALNASVRFIEGLWAKMQMLGLDRFDKVIAGGNAVEMSALVREMIGMNNK